MRTQQVISYLEKWIEDVRDFVEAGAKNFGDEIDLAIKRYSAYLCPIIQRRQY